MLLYATFVQQRGGSECLQSNKYSIYLWLPFNGVSLAEFSFHSFSLGTVQEMSRHDILAMYIPGI